MMSDPLLTKKTICVITGASRGYGRTLALKLAVSLPVGSRLLLLARNVEQLEQVCTEIRASTSDVAVFPFSFDQSKSAECTKENLLNFLTQSKTIIADYEQAMVLHNAGATGDLTKFAWEMSDSDMVQQVIDVNVTGTILFNSSFLAVFAKDVMKSRVVINISSLAAIQAFPSWSLYCSSKAARDMYFNVLVKEDSNIRVLNWAPGPMLTDMNVACRQCADVNLRNMFIEMFDQGKTLTCDQSVDKLLLVLNQNNFPSGQHLDYYDV